ncbi:Dihydrodipicolinate reductase [Elusimicrobium minutum Pei191]|uniref:4-hydroxy-tetrahydrodipicolinate reductase n=1 Tax=Elusimicrobium minutum (strain Pei191) TaxID=445932 RepID=B2KAQ8_ELUMP|nr:dihydrodipicolinate reductase C-terminal domain-containing protein [Elusimicrobium minutum]ACC97604.1 Dihydrodipicolinate reductase [Elusimicrobium minutum Pei191]
MKKVLINGAKGKMGAMIAAIIKNSPELGLEISVLREVGEEVKNPFDVVIDFSLPEGAKEAFEIAKKNKAAYLTGTTNLAAEFISDLKKETSIPVFFSPNVSIGVYMFTEILKYAQNLYRGYNRKLEEIHHVHKVDAPSGTAKNIAASLNFPVGEITAKREGEVVGTHTLTLSSDYEEIILSHVAKKRELFAESAVLIAAWLVKQKPGFYNMRNYVENK